MVPVSQIGMVLFIRLMQEGYLENVSSALRAEDSAMFHSINVVARMGWGQIILETDSVVLMQAVSTGNYSLVALEYMFY